MKLIYLLIVVVLTSCGNAMNTSDCLKSVKEEYPNAQIYRLPDSRFKFIVVDSSGIRYVTTLSMSNAEINFTKKLKIAQ